MADFAMPAAQSSTPPNDMRRLLEVVLEAIDLPCPVTVGDRETYQHILGERLALAVTVARAALAEDAGNIGWDIDYLRTRLAAHPATGYRSHGDAEAGR